jgi:hypothetical protein
MNSVEAENQIMTVQATAEMAASGAGALTEAMKALESELVSKYGEDERIRARRGMAQVASLWRAEDGDPAAFAELVRTHFAGDHGTLDTMFERFQRNLEQLDGHFQDIAREMSAQVDLDRGPILSFDELFAGFDVGAHVLEDFFTTKLAFVVLLNFPLTTLRERIEEGAGWSRRQWAETRLAQRFSKRVPAEVSMAIARAAADGQTYINQYNIWVHHVLDNDGNRLFPPGMRLIAHWNLRDEIKANYDRGIAALPQQRLLARVMEQIVTQTIPGVVVDNPLVDWEPYTNQVRPAAVADAKADDTYCRVAEISSSPEPDTRYDKWLATFRAAKLADSYSPTAPTLIARRFDEDREIPETRVRTILEQVISSPLLPQLAKLIESRLGRPLEQFDIYYNGLRPPRRYTETELDVIVAERYPNADAFRNDISDVLVKLGFSRERADYLAQHIAVDPARGAGHAVGAGMRGAKAHLRTRIESGGMNYKGFNVAMHELGHNVEQTFSLNNIDYTLLRGVPNTAFTEAIAFLFQARDLDILGLAPADPSARALKTLNNFWMTYEISGAALVDMEAWHWMYDHPEATPGEFRGAVVSIAKDLWNRYYAPVFATRDVALLGVYSHMVDYFLYLPDYPLGHLIAFQIEEQVEKAGNLGTEVERMTTIGNVSPDLWMERATGTRVGAEALLSAAERALADVLAGS